MWELPKWLRPIRDNDEWRASFNEWIEQACRIYADRALMATKDMHEVLGLKYAVGELRALQHMVNEKEEELKRIYDAERNAGSERP